MKQSIYTLDHVTLLPAGYTHPCPSEIGTHTCNRALFEIFGNGIYIGDSKLNNTSGTLSGAVTSQGTYICGDYANLPSPLTGGTWSGSSYARYNSITITQAQAIAIAATAPGSSTISFSLVAAMTTYGPVTCSGLTSPHDNITWVRIRNSAGTILYNGCPVSNIATITVCA